MKLVKKPCVVALHIAKTKQLVRQFNKLRNKLEGIHPENQVALCVLSGIDKAKKYILLGVLFEL